MQKLFIAMLSLLLGVTGTLYAQDFGESEITTAEYNDLSPDNRLFTPAPYSIGVDYMINLGRGNKFMMSLANGYDLTSFGNIDSLLALFLIDLKPLRDSLADPMTVKRIDYLIDTSGHKKLRILQYRPAGTSFLVDGGDPALLKIRQDTIYIMLVKKVAPHAEGKNVNGLRYDRLCFFLNRYSDLDTYVAGGLNESIDSILRDMKPRRHEYNCPFCYAYRSPNIKSRLHYGNGLVLNFSMGIQNYSNYFVPSFTINPGVILNRDRHVYTLRAYWEPLFFFTTNPEGQVQTLRNDLVGVGYEVFDKDHPNGVRPSVSFGWIAHGDGNYFGRKPAFSLRAFDWQHGPIRVQPGIYFDHFFRNVSPSLRLTVGGF